MIGEYREKQNGQGYVCLECRPTKPRTYAGFGALVNHMRKDHGRRPLPPEASHHG